MTEFISNNLLELASLFISILGFIYAVVNTKIAKKGYTIAKTTLENQQAKFKIDYDDIFRLNLHFFDQSRFLFFHVKISNISQSNNSFSIILEIEYYDEDGNKTKVILDHSPDLIDKVPKQKIVPLEKNFSVEGNGLLDGWVLFKQPEKLSNLRIDNYRVILCDVNGNHSSFQAILVKDVIYEV